MTHDGVPMPTTALPLGWGHTNGEAADLSKALQLTLDLGRVERSDSTSLFTPIEPAFSSPPLYIQSHMPGGQLRAQVRLIERDTPNGRGPLRSRWTPGPA
jgi:hypothetical protein